MTSPRLIPPNPNNLYEWAQSVYQFLRQDRPIKDEVNPAPILLARRTSETKAGDTDGMLLYDTNFRAPVYSKDGAWIELSGDGTVPPPSDEVRWDDILNKPTEYPPESHTHPWGEITSKPSTFPPQAHNHSINDVTNLSNQLAGKVDKVGTSVVQGRVNFLALGTGYPLHIRANSSDNNFAKMSFGSDNDISRLTFEYNLNANEFYIIQRNSVGGFLRTVLTIRSNGSVEIPGLV